MKSQRLVTTAMTVAGLGMSTLVGTAVADAAPAAPPPCANCQQDPGDGAGAPLQDPPKMGGGPSSGGRSYEVPGQPLQDRAPAAFAITSPEAASTS